MGFFFLFIFFASYLRERREEKENKFKKTQKRKCLDGDSFLRKSKKRKMSPLGPHVWIIWL